MGEKAGVAEWAGPSVVPWVPWEWEEMLVGSLSGEREGPAAGRLEAALRGAEGELGRWAALKALDGALQGARQCQFLAEPDPLQTHGLMGLGEPVTRPRRPAGLGPGQPLPLPDWALSEALPGLLDLALATATPKDQQEASVKLLHHFRFPTHIGAVVAALLSGWARYEEGLSRCFLPESFDKELAGWFLGLLEEYGSRKHPPPPALPAQPFLGALDGLLGTFRRRPDLGALEAEAGWGSSAPLLSVLHRLLYPGRRPSPAFSVVDVLAVPGLASGLFQAAAAVGDGCRREWVLCEVLRLVPAADERVCLFLCHGGARLLLDHLQLRRLPYHWIWSEMLDAVCQLLPASLEPASLALRARLLRDAGLIDYLRRRARGPRSSPQTKALVKAFLDSHDAALRQPASRLPASIHFPY